ncbi:MAG: corrinoid protein [Betaproteobacteria bacterium]|nr:corrinoid protein [Betaproteobacteria bacterium]
MVGRGHPRRRRARRARLLRRLADQRDPARPHRLHAVLLPLQGPPGEDAPARRAYGAAVRPDHRHRVRLARRRRLVGRQLRRHDHLPALLRAGDLPLDRQGVRRAGPPRQVAAEPHRRRERRPDGPDPRLGHAHRRIDLPGADDQGLARRVLPAVEPEAHALRRRAVDHRAGRDERRRLRGLHGRAVPGGRAGRALPSRHRRPGAPERDLLAAAADRRARREGRLAAAQAGDARPQDSATLARAASATIQDTGDDVFAAVRQDVMKGRHILIKDHVNELLAGGTPAQDILDRGLIAAIDVVGKRMAAGQAYIPEVLLAARAMSAAVGLLEPHLAASGDTQRGKIVIGTVTGDMHDIGKNLVVTMLKGVGFDVVDLGVNVSRDQFCDAVEKLEPDVLGLSALLTTTMMEMREIIRALDARGLRQRCKVLVGGAPVSEQFARQIGADGFAPDAFEAVALAKRLTAAQPA